MLEKMRGGLEKNKFFFIDFHPKSTKHQAKNGGKRHSQQKSMKQRSLGRLFWEKVDFWSFLASPGGPKNVSKGCTIIGEDHSWTPSCAILVR